MKKPILIDQFADNGELSHWHLIDPETGGVLWSSFPEETLSQGQKIESNTFPSEEEIKTGAAEKEKYHLEGMTNQFGELVPVEFAALCCGNSFNQGIEFVINKKIK